LVGKPEEKRPFERNKSRWEDNIITDLREIGRQFVDWIHLAHEKEPVAGCSEHGNEPSVYIKGE
jgi:hypothetical protein